MEKNLIFVTIILWICATLLLTCTIIGMILFIPDESGRKSSWMIIGDKLINKLTE